MLCPKCGAENPVGRGFCVKCAYPLPDETARPTTVEPIAFSQFTPVQRRRLGIGIAALVMGLLGALNAFFLVSIFSTDMELLKQSVEQALRAQGMDLAAYNISAQAMIGMVVCVYAFFGLLFGLLGTIFGGVGVAKLQKNPQLYRGKGVCLSGLILSVLSLITATVGFVVAMSWF